MPNFEIAYLSLWHHPRLLLAAHFVMTLVVLLQWRLWSSLRRRQDGPSRFALAWGAFFGLEIALDAILTATNSPLLPEHPALNQNLAILFVFLGDARVYILLEHLRRPGGRPVRPLVLGLLLASVTSLLTVPATSLFPTIASNTRYIFLTYEVLALVQLVAYGVFAWRKTDAPLRWAWTKILQFVLLQYSLWALADVVILWIGPWGFGLRIIPNLLYYGFFVGYALLCTSRRASHE